MRHLVTGSLLAFAVALGGCRDQDPEDFPVTSEREPYEELTTAADTASEEFASEEAVGVIAVQGGRRVAGPFTATGNLEGPSAAAPPGSVTITESDGATDVLLTLHGYEAGSELQAAFVRGECGQPGQLVQAVEPLIEVPPEGIATYETTVDLVTETLFDGAHSLRLSSPEEFAPGAQQVGLGVACANLMEVS